MGKIADTARAWGIGQEQLRQMLAFDRELEETKTERDALQAKNLQLKAQVEPLQAEVERLKKQVKEQAVQAARAEKLAAHKASKQAETKQEEHLDENEIRLLKFLAAFVIKGI